MIRKVYDLPCSSAGLLTLFYSEPHVFLLDSSMFEKERGRYSMLGFDPFYVYQHKGKGSLDKLKEKFYQYGTPQQKSDVPFSCGMVGFLGYDYGLYQENIPLKATDDLQLPDCFFGFYDCVLVIDHLKNQLMVAATGYPEKNSYYQEAKIKDRLDFIEKRLSVLGERTYGSEDCFGGAPADHELKSNFTRDQYIQAVTKALRYIEAGDIYQVNLSQRFSFEAPFKLDPVNVYQALRRLSPSSFGGYFQAGKFQIISSSPERFLCLRDDQVHTRPMKGTRPRGNTKQEDEKFRREIMESPKDKAELLMITDLERNDLGRVCEYGSIRVKDMRSIEAYKTVYQATSTVEGKLKKDKDGFDLLQACFPGGSVTGCPKIRAMEIIEELEPTRRGIYTGSLGYMDFNGNMDFNILIRTLLTKGHKAHFQVGGGIVADSTAIGEYEETLIKAKAMKAALFHGPLRPSLKEPSLYSPAL
ncbi:MAG TPA: aminodeoxychorismate synthase component I [Candidatus Omnitrophota bacterium]|nr:aminodeoxychorismate synthase component I [Candidatus Omnitrophota bacterium]